MKVTLINHSDTLGGASVVTFRLTEALRRRGVDARMLVTQKNSDSPFVEQATTRLRGRIPFYREHLGIFTHNGFSKKRLFQVSTGSDGLPLSRHPLVAESDAIILNWVNQGMLSLDEIGRIARMKPTFWTMHDQWNFTGICHHTGGCERFTTHCHDCPFLGCMASKQDLSSRVFDRKKALYDSTAITFVAVSEWLAGRARQSALLSGRPLATIYNPFDVENFRKSTQSRREPGLPEGKKLIVFCAARIDDPGKGLREAVGLLNGIAATHGDTAEAVFVGALRNPEALGDLRLRHVVTGAVTPDRIPSIMGRASVVLSTSPFETLATTLIEAQAAGATPVGYIHDGRGDIITDGVNGYALEGNMAADINTLRKALDCPIGEEALLKAAGRFSEDRVAQSYIDLIEGKITV